MSEEQNKAVVRRIHQELMNQRNLALVDELFAPNFVHALFPGGREGFKQLMTTFLSAVPDTQVTVEDVLADGDKVVTRGRLSGTHQGERLEATYIDIWRLADGKVVENWIESAIFGMLQQRGVGPAPTQASTTS